MKSTEEDGSQSASSNALLALLKLGVMILFPSIVIYVGSMPYRLQVFTSSHFCRSMSTTFAGAIFFNVALLHILPQASEAISTHLKAGTQQQVFPLANLLVIVGFLITIGLTKLATTHHHQQASSQTREDSISSRKDIEMNEIRTIMLHNNLKQENLNESLQIQTTNIPNNQRNRVYLMTAAMYFHTFFEGIAIGVQNDMGGFASLAFAVGIHKWADSLSMGMHYYNNKIAFKMAFKLIVVQALLNSLGLGVGWAIDGFGNFIEAIFLSISGGTFLAISLMQILADQLNRKSYKIYKFLVLILSTCIISLAWYVEQFLFSQTD